MSTVATTAGTPIGELIRLARESRGVSQSDLAEKIGMTRGGLCQIEQGQTYPRFPTLEAICAALEFSLDFSPLPAKKKPARKK